MGLAGYGVLLVGVTYTAAVIFSPKYDADPPRKFMLPGMFMSCSQLEGWRSKRWGQHVPDQRWRMAHQNA